MTTPDGYQPISQLQPGDFVLAYDEATGTTGYYPVTAVWASMHATVVRLVVNGQVLVTTDEHPFYVEGKGWVPAGELQVGEQILRADGSFGVVETLTTDASPQPMWNLTVEGAHTFFVGAQQWLVHNTCGGWQFPSLRKTSQANVRGWTQGDIDSVLHNPAETRPHVDLSTVQPATVYYRKDGHYVVRNDVTGDVFHVSNTSDPHWIDPFGNTVTPR